jgi:hypothetical protein
MLCQGLSFLIQAAWAYHEVRLSNLGAQVPGPVPIALARLQEEHAVSDVQDVWVFIQLLG